MASDANARGPDSREPERLARVTRAVEGHYTRGNLAGVILGAVEQAAADPAHLTIDDLAPADEFHIGGRAATVRLNVSAGRCGPWEIVARHG